MTCRRCLFAVVPALYLTVSLITFAAYALDKRAAKNSQSRTRESTLHLLALIGGWPGALLAQKMLRHKSKKRSFQIVFRCTMLRHCLLLAWLLMP
jgi:uncharacterized membrane protein YsdA (DUF1294 family)